MKITYNILIELIFPEFQERIVVFKNKEHFSEEDQWNYQIILRIGQYKDTHERPVTEL